MIALGLILIFFILLTALNYRVQRSVLYPPFIFTAMWALDLAVVCSGLLKIDALHTNTLAIVAAGASAFSLGGFLASLAPRRFFRLHLFRLTREAATPVLRNLLMIFLLACLPIMLLQILQLGNLRSNGFAVLMQARLALVEAAKDGEPIHSFVLDYFVTIAIFTSLLFAIEKRDRNFWIVTATAFIGCILSTGRTSLLLLVSGLSAIRLLQTNQVSLRRASRMLRVPIALFVVLYIALIFSNKNTEGMVGGMTGIATYFVLSYISGPLAAFDRVVQHPADFALSTSHTFEFPLKLAAALHLTDYTPPPKFDSFVLVPFPTNVYTVYKFFFLDLGLAGTVAIFLIIGLLHSLLYLKAKQGGAFSTFLFAFSLYAVLMVIFDDAYYTVGIYLRAIAFGLIYFSIGSMRLRLLPAFRPRLEGNPDLSA